MSPSSVAGAGKKRSQSLVFCRRKKEANANGADAPKKEDCWVCICPSFALWMHTPKSLLLSDHSRTFGEADLKNKPALYQKQNVTWHLDAACSSALGKRRRGKMQHIFPVLGTVCVVFACLSEIASLEVV